MKKSHLNSLPGLVFLLLLTSSSFAFSHDGFSQPGASGIIPSAQSPQKNTDDFNGVRNQIALRNDIVEHGLCLKQTPPVIPNFTFKYESTDSDNHWKSTVQWKVTNNTLTIATALLSDSENPGHFVNVSSQKISLDLVTYKLTDYDGKVYELNQISNRIGWLKLGDILRQIQYVTDPKSLPFPIPTNPNEIVKTQGSRARLKQLFKVVQNIQARTYDMTSAWVKQDENILVIYHTFSIENHLGIGSMFGKGIVTPGTVALSVEKFSWVDLKTKTAYRQVGNGPVEQIKFANSNEYRKVLRNLIKDLKTFLNAKEYQGDAWKITRRSVALSISDLRKMIRASYRTR